MSKTVSEGITFDDVFLRPGKSEILPGEVGLKTRFSKKVSMNVPISSAAMDTVTESATAIAIARQGGIGIIHKNLSVERQAEEVDRVKRVEYWIITEPVTVSPEDSLQSIIGLSKKIGISSFPVVERGKLVGIVTRRDWQFEKGGGKKVKEIMTKKVITTGRLLSADEATKIMHKHRVEKLPIVDKAGKLKGLITSRDILSKRRYPNANKDKDGRLIVGGAAGVKDDARVKALVEEEVDVIVVDTAHGHSKNVIDAIKRIKKNYSVDVVGGNIGTKEGAEAIISAGADAVKAGVGPGAICTTRVVSGVGVPQITAIMDSAEPCEKAGIPLISDGGIKYSGDITKALAAGADSVMAGALFAGCEETPGKIVFMQNRKFKQYRGMGSISAMMAGSSDRYFQMGVEDRKLVPEGIEGVVPYKGAVEEVVLQLAGGLRSGMGYVGAKNIPELKKKARFIRVSAAGLKESHPHDIRITEESPNYSPLYG